MTPTATVPSPSVIASSGAGRRVGLVVDHPRRDLDGLVLLATALGRRGLRPLLLPMYQHVLDAALLGLDAVVANFIRPNNAAVLAEWHAAGRATFVLDTEGGVLSEKGHNAPPRFAETLAALGAADALDGYLFWGPRLAEATLAIRAMAPEQVAVTGCPRFDFCREPWRQRLGPRRGDYVLVNTNFSLINPAMTVSGAVEKQTLVRVGWEATYVEALVADLEQVFVAYRALLRRLFEATPGLAYRVRPHPFEDHATYRESFAGLANVTVDGSGSAAQAIQRARCVLHLNCGSSVEALMLERLPVQMELLNTPIQRLHTPLPARLSLAAGDFEGLKQIVEEAEAAAEAFDFAGVAERELSPFFGPLDGAAAERAADYIADRLAQLRPPPGRPDLARALAGGRARPGHGQRLQGLAGSLLGTHAAEGLRRLTRPARRLKRLDTLQVQAQLDSLDALRADGRRHRVRRARHPLTGLPLESLRIEPL